MEAIFKCIGLNVCVINLYNDNNNNISEIIQDINILTLLPIYLRRQALILFLEKLSRYEHWAIIVAQPLPGPTAQDILQTLIASL